MTIDKFEVMEAMASISASKKFEEAIRVITNDLYSSGFDDDDIKQYLERVVGFVVDDTVDPL